jgi:5-methylcytosine-specific restriction endonuclease McrA
MCGHEASTVCDHHPLTAREVVAQFGIAAFYDVNRCQGLCASCHSSKTALEDSTFAHHSSS